METSKREMDEISATVLFSRWASLPTPRRCWGRLGFLMVFVGTNTRARTCSQARRGSFAGFACTWLEVYISFSFQIPQKGNERSVADSSLLGILTVPGQCFCKHSPKMPRSWSRDALHRFPKASTDPLAAAYLSFFLSLSFI